MTDPGGSPVTWSDCRRALGKCWLALVLFEIVYSTIAATLLAPSMLALFQIVVELSGEEAIGNEELKAFLLSPLGVVTLSLGGVIWLGLLFLEIAGLVLIFTTALRQESSGWVRMTWSIAGLAPRLFAVAGLQTLAVLAVVLPVAAIAVLLYRALFSAADINYFLDTRPPRFWLGVSIGGALAVLAGYLIGLILIRFAFAVPACAVHRQGIRSALRSSWQLTRGRVWRLAIIVGGWQLARVAVLAGSGAGLDALNELVLPRLEGSLPSLLISTGLVVALNVIVLSILSAAFSIVLAVLLTVEYVRATPSWKVGDIESAVSLASAPARTKGAAWSIAGFLCGSIGLSAVDAALIANRFAETRPVAVTAHRAGPSPAAENSLPALSLAIKSGADFAEIDVQLTRDGQVVLLHDRDLRRSSGVAKNLTDLTSAELSEIRLHYGRNPNASHEPIPTLNEFLDAAQGQIRLNVELKDYSGTGELPPRVVERLRAADAVGDSVVSCLDLAPLRQVKQLAPEIKVGMILSASVGDPTRLPVDFLSLQQRKISSDLVRRAHRRGMEVHVWSVKTREDALRAIELGADNLITDDPATIRAVVDWYADLSDVEVVLLGLRRWIRE